MKYGQEEVRSGGIMAKREVWTVGRVYQTRLWDPMITRSHHRDPGIQVFPEIHTPGKV